MTTNSHATDLVEVSPDLGAPEDVSKVARISELREQLEEIRDLLKAIDLIGDGVGGEIGFAVSAVALSARTIADNVAHQIQVMEGGK